ncbi:hypothetical protein B0I35DRAFT_473122 [Stachybotrys elegans]|uniref:Uncharacterized protein n=1 Tax=Stachybotrys elegans TaxID=80388 RepID=A0A8K0T780_9HYPO|nr:hypothetical protein B0I35DRAFT_473122 [Stachybotrys elegans]
MDRGFAHVNAPMHAANMDFTMKELQRRVDEHERKLEAAQRSQRDLPSSAIAQARIITAALDEVTDSEPILPFPGSVLPALLALRRTHQTIEESRAFLSSHKPKVEQVRRQLETDRAGLRDQTLLTDALTAQIQALREELDSRADAAPEDGVRERLDALKQKKKRYDRETSRLMKAVTKFIDDPLAAMLAAEELGGPVVGDVMDIDAADLAAGFNAQGKLNKPKNGISQDKRQRRIDEIWGTVDGQTRQTEEEDEVTSAANEMKQLTEALLNSQTNADTDSSAAYVKLTRESAAARFLVRSKVAQFHPKDATRLRLVDFGRELDE